MFHYKDQFFLTDEGGKGSVHLMQKSNDTQTAPLHENAWWALMKKTRSDEGSWSILVI